MNVSLILLTAAVASYGVVYSIKDLNDPIRYIDSAQSYFIAIRANRYRMGTAVDAIKSPNADMPQFSDKVENCSSKRFKCKSIGALKFVIPKSKVRSVTYDAGPNIRIKQLKSGNWYASATCPRLAPSGCESRADGGGPELTYQYEVSKVGVLTAIKIQHWNDQKVQVAHENLVLSGGLGLKL